MEYGLLIAGIAALVALVMFAFGHDVIDLFDDACDSIASQAATPSC